MERRRGIYSEQAKKEDLKKMLDRKYDEERSGWWDEDDERNGKVEKP